MDKFEVCTTHSAYINPKFIHNEQLRHAGSSLESMFISQAAWEIIAIDCHVIVTPGAPREAGGAR